MRLHRPYLAANLSRKQLLRRYVTIMRYSANVCRRKNSVIFEYPRAATGEAGRQKRRAFTLELTMMISMDKEGDSTILSATAKVFLWQRSRLPCVNIREKNDVYWRTARRKMGNSTSEIQNATKACHGLFPKRLVMERPVCLPNVCR